MNKKGRNEKKLVVSTIIQIIQVFQAVKAHLFEIKTESGKS